MKLLIATTNPGKLTDFKLFLSDLPLKLVSLTDLKIKQKPEETGATFSENAILKVKYYNKLTGLPTLADDGGLEIDALNGEPGVCSHRWVNKNHENSDADLINYTLTRMQDIPLNKRGAQLHLVLALFLKNGKIITKEEYVRGIIPFSACKKSQAGYPYRSLLYFPKISKYYVELNEKEAERFNHRKRAVAKMKPIIQERILKV